MIKRTLLAVTLTLATTQASASPLLELVEALEGMRTFLEQIIKEYRYPCGRADYAHSLGEGEFIIPCDRGRHVYFAKPVDGIPRILKVK